MSISNIIKFTEENPILIWKWRTENNKNREDEIRLGSQLIVSESQEAIFVKGGKIYDSFGPGQYTLATKNLPLLSQAIGVFFNNESPFQASIYFINKNLFMNNKFGLPQFNLIEPNFKVPIPVSARGSYSLQITNSRNLLIQLTGTTNDITPDVINDYFKGLICTEVKKGIINVVKSEKISPIELETQIETVTRKISSYITTIFSEYGLSVKHFVIEGIPIIDDDPRVKEVVDRLQRLWADDIEEKMKFKRHSENLDIYKTERIFDTVQTAAENLGNSGLAGTFIGMQASPPIGNALAGMVNSTLNQNFSTDNNKQNIKTIKCDKCGAESPIGTKFCTKCGDPFITCPNCNMDNPSNTKFCIFCGSPMNLVCDNCGASYTKGALFCGSCGKKLK